MKTSMYFTVIALLCLGNNNAVLAEEEPACAAPMPPKPCDLFRFSTCEEFRTLCQGKQPCVTSRPVELMDMPEWKEFQDACSKEKLGKRKDLVSQITTNQLTANTVKTMNLGLQYLSMEQYISRLLSKKPNEFLYFFGSNNGPEWQKFLDSFPSIAREPLKLFSCTAYMESGEVLFGAAPAGTGLPWHEHDGGISEIVLGHKRWMFNPPGAPIHTDPHANVSMWYADYIKNKSRSPKVLSCDVGPGDVVYYPSSWSHAVLNIAPWNACASTFIDMRRGRG